MSARRHLTVGRPPRGASSRVRDREVGQARNDGCIEYPSHYLKGLGSPVGIVFDVTGYSGEIRLNLESEDGAWFTRLPHGVHADQDQYLIQHGYLTG
ncbi:MAG: hypothetical protein ACRD0Z_13295 [Acidimicrobiales bacterium]